MLVVLLKNQLIAPQTVCQSCLMADHSGQPRWDQGKLRCGRQLANLDQGPPVQFECQMGFRIAEIS